MRTGEASGFQIAFFIYAAWLLVVPFSMLLGRWMQLSTAEQAIFGRYVAVVAAGAGLLLIGPIRRTCARTLRHPWKAANAEVATLSMVMVVEAFAWVGAYVLWWHVTEGSAGVEGRMATIGTHEQAMAKALDPVPALAYLIVGVVVAPFVEELIFRRFLFEAWSRRFGWFTSMILSSLVFASLHESFFPAFTSSLLFTCIYRRTASIRSSIFVHAMNNLFIFYPLLGRWIFPRGLDAPGDLQSWTFHLTCLLAMVVIWPMYIWMSRDGDDELPIPLEEDHVALPR